MHKWAGCHVKTEHNLTINDSASQCFWTKPSKYHTAFMEKIFRKLLGDQGWKYICKHSPTHQFESFFTSKNSSLAWFGKHDFHFWGYKFYCHHNMLAFDKNILLKNLLLTVKKAFSNLPGISVMWIDALMHYFLHLPCVILFPFRKFFVKWRLKRDFVRVWPFKWNLLAMSSIFMWWSLLNFHIFCTIGCRTFFQFRNCIFILTCEGLQFLHKRALQPQLKD